jgi:AcrR family transcriptional regulator
VHGYANLSFDAIATQAGVHRTTICRRWRTRDRLVAAAFMDAAERRLDVADTGNIDHDARALARSVAATLAEPIVAAAIRATLSASSHEVRHQIARRFWASREAAVGPIIERAIERGQLPRGSRPTDIIAAIAAPLYFRLLVSGEPLTASAALASASTALASASTALASASAALAAALAAARPGVFIPRDVRSKR